MVDKKMDKEMDKMSDNRVQNSKEGLDSENVSDGKRYSVDSGDNDTDQGYGGSKSGARGDLANAQNTQDSGSANNANSTNSANNRGSAGNVGAEAAGNVDALEGEVLQSRGVFKKGVDARLNPQAAFRSGERSGNGGDAGAQRGFRAKSVGNAQFGEENVSKFGHSKGIASQSGTVLPEHDRGDKIFDFSELKNLFKDLRSFLFSNNASEIKHLVVPHKELKDQLSKPIKFGFVIIAIAVSFFGIWSSIAPLDSASIATGFIVPSSKPKIIQHLEGGIIKEILVSDGDRVVKGQALMVLDGTGFKSDVAASLSNLRTSLVIERRLIAESLGKSKIDFSSPYLDGAEEEVKTLIRNQRDLLAAKNSAFKEGVNSIKETIKAYEYEKGALKAKLDSFQSQLAPLKEQMESMKSLADQGLATRYDLVNMQQRYYDLEGHIGEVMSKITGVASTIDSKRAELLRYIEEHKYKIQEEYKENHQRLLSFVEQYQKSNDQFVRSTIKSPVDGIVSHVVFHTVGGIIPPHTNKIMDIIPIDDELIAEVEIKPQDIDHVRVGMETKLQLAPFKQRLVPRIDGTIFYVSADKIDRGAGNPLAPQANSAAYDSDQMPTPSYYAAKIRIDHAQIAKLNADVKLQPGMPVTAFIVEGERTFLKYLLSPIIDSFHKAFKEA